MNELGIVALIVVGIWLGVLTLVVLLMVRQIGVLTVRFSHAGNSFSFVDDGPEVGSSVPPEVIVTLPELTQGRSYLLLLSATCTPCRELATALRGQHFEPRVVALVPGQAELADGIAALLPSETGIVRDPDASSFAKALQIKSAPFALIIEDGTVIRKGYMYQAAGFVALLTSDGTSTMSKAAHTVKEVEYVG